MLRGLVLVGVGVALVAAGGVYGTLHVGPAHGVRLTLAIEPPVTADARDIARHVARERVAEKGFEIAVEPHGDEIDVEIPDDLESEVDDIAALLERTGTLEIHLVVVDSTWLAGIVELAKHDPAAQTLGVRVDAGELVAADRWVDRPVAEADALGCHGRVEDGHRHCLQRGDRTLAAYLHDVASRSNVREPDERLTMFGRCGPEIWCPYVLDSTVILSGRAIRRVELHAGVELEVVDNSGFPFLAPGKPLAFVLDGHVKAVVSPDYIANTTLRLPLAGSNDDDAYRAADELIAVVEAGAAHPLHVTDRETFSRTTGFLPRAWPMLAAGVLAVLAGLWWWRRRAVRRA